MSAGPSLLLVDDDELLRTRLARALSARGYEVRTACDADEALALARAESPELALVDLRMPAAGAVRAGQDATPVSEPTGLAVVRELRAIDPTTRIVVLTGYGSIATAVEAVRLGAHDYLTKPADADQIVAAFAVDGSRDPSTYDVPSLARVEWEHIQRVLADAEGNVSEAARRLRIHRRTLQRKLEKFAPR